MNTRIISLNQYIIIISWSGDFKAYITYHKDGKQVTDWGTIDSYHQLLISAVVDATCYSLKLDKYSY